MPTPSLRRRVTAEFVGTLFLVSTVIGSGIMAERLAGTNVALALLANTIATGAILVALIFTFGGISGAHFNAAVTVADALEHGMPWPEVPAYVAAQCSGGLGRDGDRASYVRAAARFTVAPRKKRRRSSVQRVRCHIWASRRDLGLLASSSQRCAVRGWSLHHGCVLVHILNVVRKPGSDYSQRSIEHVRGNPSA